MDTARGLLLLNKYLATLPDRRQHSLDVFRFGSRVAQRIAEHEPIDSDLVEFLCLVHDIGYSVEKPFHEIHTLELLLKEKVPYKIAQQTVHGPVYEALGDERYLPQSVESIVLNYADASVRFGDPVSLDQRFEEIKARVPRSVLRLIEQSRSRFKQYEKTVLNLAKVSSYRDF